MLSDDFKKFYFIIQDFVTDVYNVQLVKKRKCQNHLISNNTAMKTDINP